MAENSGIEWTDHTFNPWIGCTKVSPACDHCYAERVGFRLQVAWGTKQPRKRTSESNWNEPRRWNRRAEAAGKRERVFCASLADVFDNEVPIAWRLDLFRLISETPNLDWLILTKRIGNVASMLGDYPTVPLLPNVWLGISVVTQEEVDRDVPKLLAVPAAKRFLSIEPMLGPIDLSGALWECCGSPQIGAEYMGQVEQVCCGMPTQRDELDWVIVGGESGPNARPMNPQWPRSLRDQCAAANVPFFFKQWGEWADAFECVGGDWPAVFWSDGGLSARVGKKAAGSELDGVEHKAWPA